MIAEINKSWNWKGLTATEIIQTNDFGNIIFKTDRNEYWRICPEELSCDKIAENELDLKKIMIDSEFVADWEMTNLINIAKSEIGELNSDEKYCLKKPAVVGGEYDKSNIGKINFSELIAYSGDLGGQIKDLKEGQKIKLKIKN